MSVFQHSDEFAPTLPIGKASQKCTKPKCSWLNNIFLYLLLYCLYFAFSHSEHLSSAISPNFKTTNFKQTMLNYSHPTNKIA